ncbi:MFS transporter [Actinomadura darangshiensis]|uniref:MFS transporter n=1 Tax=Actinomadura darangshiensis TaxID=705336 RepID=A0A4R5BGP3_9ACTN|nr:MFS transporter [Actinomadura darangshiensis]TDD84619.1 MFS transporter [Actinomadura darangshiensis]
MALDLTPSHGAAPRYRLLLALAVIILFSETATFEVLMVMPALPDMAAHYRTTDTAWVVSILTLAGATVMPLVGRAADRWGKKRVILLLGCAFLAGGVLCATADSFALLLTGRALQGSMVGIVGLSYSLVRDIMPRNFVPVALGMVVTGVGMSAVAGPFAAGALIDAFGFRGIFWFMVAYAAILLPLYALLIPESRGQAGQPIDYLGSVLLGPAAAALLYGLSRGSQDGWTSGAALGLLLAGALLLAGFLVRQRTARHPLIEPRILFGARFGPTLLAVGCVSYMMNAHALLVPTMLRTPPGAGGTGYGAGLSATGYATWTWPLGALAMITGPLGGYLAKRIGPRRVLLGSACLFLATLYAGGRLPHVFWQVAMMSVIAGMAVGFLHSSNANLVQDALPSSHSGVGNTIGAMNSLLAASIGSTVTGIVMADHVRATDPVSHAVLYEPGAFTSGYLYAAAVGAAGLVVALVMRHGHRPAQGGLAEDGGRPVKRDDSPLPT